jgi:hypothetical protein
MSNNKRLPILLIVSLLLMWSLNACSTKKSFYELGSGWDYLRFPLLEPYYAIKIDDELGWQISLHAEPSQRNFRHFLNIRNVQKIAVEKGMVLVYSPYSKAIDLLDGQKKELHYFILLPNQNELGFETEEELSLILQQYGINQPQWQEPFSILTEFDQSGCLKWIPTCN